MLCIGVVSIHNVSAPTMHHSVRVVIWGVWCRGSVCTKWYSRATPKKNAV